MRTLAIVPVKGFGAAKQRLSDRLASGARQSLMQAMVSDVLASLRRSRRLDGIAVVTADKTAESIAVGDRIAVVHDTEQAGQSAAAELGIRHALADGFDRVLLVPGDAPMIDPVETDLLLDRCAEHEVSAAIVPDRHGTGTNALLLTPPDCLHPAFGPDSRERHEQLAREAGVLARVEPLDSLALDVDTADDLATLAAALEERRGAAPRTRGAIRQLARAGMLRTARPVEVA